LKFQNMYANYTIKDLIYMAKNYTEENRISNTCK
jgi:hypothetical protein